MKAGLKRRELETGDDGVTGGGLVSAAEEAEMARLDIRGLCLLGDAVPAIPPPPPPAAAAAAAVLLFG